MIHAWIVVAALLMLAFAHPAAGTAPTSSLAGSAACRPCHVSQYRAWQGSHHDLAMQPANEHTVLGDFSGAQFTYAGITSRFFRRHRKYLVRTDGPDGELHDYEIGFTFGVYPLQQYLIALPGGRLQALSIAWDTRPKSEGGQQWFHLYPSDTITASDPLHWTGMYQNWNYMCADCHSTGVRRNYDATTKRYRTEYAEINVGCEACHGAGRAHVAWATDPKRDAADTARALPVRFAAPATWMPNPTMGTAERGGAAPNGAEIAACAPCHARRSPIAAHYVAGTLWLDAYRPQLLTADLYYPDGQIREEVYEYGSFLQSRMHAAGVTCSDCHDPHTLQLRAPGNALCGRCHAAERFDTPAHHFHAAGSAAAQCVACHAPTTTYMGIDARRDHSFRIPRPDRSATLAAPDACTGCHRDRSAAWAATELTKRRGKPKPGFQDYALALHGARTGHPQAARLLAGVVRDPTAPSIARATALLELAGYLSEQTIPQLTAAASDPDPSVRAAAANTIAALPPPDRVKPGAPLLRDPVRSVRLEAANALADVPPSLLSEAQRQQLDAALAEDIAAQLAIAERPEAHANLGLLYQRLGRTDEAVRAYRDAIALQPAFDGAYLNLADLYRTLAREKEGERVLRDGVRHAPDSPALPHALGLLLVREKRYPEALTALATAVRLAPDDARYAYVYAIALDDLGQPARAIEVLQHAQRRQPANAELLQALIHLSVKAGQFAEALRYAEQLQALDPPNASVNQLVAQLRERAPPRAATSNP